MKAYLAVYKYIFCQFPEIKYRIFFADSLKQAKLKAHNHDGEYLDSVSEIKDGDYIVSVKY